MNKLLAIFLAFSMSVSAFGNDMIDKLQAISVTVQSEDGSGSGVIKTRKVDNNQVSFIWTAAHVVTNLRHTRKVLDGKTGTERVIVEYDDANVVQTINEDGRLVATYSLLATVVKVSVEEDLALLRVRKNNFSTASAKFCIDDKPIALGEEVWNVGSPLGIIGSNTVSKGIVSQHGRILPNHKVYDQVSCPGFPGCSGSGVYIKDGSLMGILTNGHGENFILVVPSRRIVKWAKSVNLEWAVNDLVPAPSEKDLEKIVVEDNGVNFDARSVSLSPVKPHSLFRQMDYNSTKNRLYFYAR